MAAMICLTQFLLFQSTNESLWVNTDMLFCNQYWWPKNIELLQPIDYILNG